MKFDFQNTRAPVAAGCQAPALSTGPRLRPFRVVSLTLFSLKVL